VYRLEPLSLLRSILVWDGADEVVAPTVLVTPRNLIVTALRDVLVPNRYGRGGVAPSRPISSAMVAALCAAITAPVRRRAYVCALAVG